MISHNGGVVRLSGWWAIGGTAQFVASAANRSVVLMRALGRCAIRSNASQPVFRVVRAPIGTDRATTNNRFGAVVLGHVPSDYTSAIWVCGTVLASCQALAVITVRAPLDKD